MKQFVLILFLVSSALLASDTLRLEDSQDAMGTTFSIVLYGTDAFRMRAASEQAFEEARRLERMLSNYRKESEWSEVNRDAADRPGDGGVQPDDRGERRDRAPRQKRQRRVRTS